MDKLPVPPAMAPLSACYAAAAADRSAFARGMFRVSADIWLAYVRWLILTSEMIIQREDWRVRWPWHFVYKGRPIVLDETLPAQNAWYVDAGLDLQSGGAVVVLTKRDVLRHLPPVPQPAAPNTGDAES